MGGHIMKRILSRKFLMAVATAVIIILNEGLGWNIDGETILQALYVILGYIFVEGARDVVAARQETALFCRRETALFCPCNIGTKEEVEAIGSKNGENLTE